MRIHYLATLIGATFLASGCAAGSDWDGLRGGGLQRGAGESRIGSGPLFVSPSGAVFRRVAHGSAPITIWFGAADADSNGVLDWAEFQADFDRAFVSFDRDGDGEIEPDEVTYYETRILPEMASPGMFGGGVAGARNGGMERGSSGRPPQGRRRGSGGPPDGGARMNGAARFGLLRISHPIMEADENFNRGINRAEWAAAARQRFNQLDRERNGLLRLDQLQRPRTGPPPGAARRPRNRPD